jgi:hypothetical protein
LRENRVYFNHPTEGFFCDFKGVTKGLVMEAEKAKKNQTRRNSIKNRKRNQKRYWEN